MNASEENRPSLPAPHACSRRLLVSVLSLAATVAMATSNYEYGADEYVTVRSGISPNQMLAITTHGGGEMGYDGFHVFLTNAQRGR